MLRERLRILRSSNDGFEIAEKDLDLRGISVISWGFSKSGDEKF